jgi:hypothetical protein
LHAQTTRFGIAIIRPGVPHMRSAHRKEEMRRSWHSADRAFVIARRFGVTENALRVFWRREKNAGRLPGGARPELDRTAPLQPFVGADLPDEDISAAPDEPEGHGDVPRIPPVDPLLLALRESYPGYDHPAFNTVPASVLNVEARTSYVPTPEILRAMAKGHDKFMRRVIASKRLKP